MEEEQRKKKLEAGKEKLAAFRKKKAKKRRKPTDDDASSQRSGNMADASSCSDVQSLTGDSDQGSLVSYSGEEWSGEEADMHSSVYYQTKLVDATRRVAELEEMMEGKQLALDKVVQENDQLRQQPKHQQTPDNVDKENNIAEGREGVAEPRVHLGDLHSALAQRDLIIQQLTSRLKATAEKSSHDYTQETQTLAHQVSLLQQQLQQAGETLRTQLNQHNVSAQALQEAKAEILALQSLLQEKEQVLAQLRQTKMEDPQRLEQREKELESSVHGFESKTKELEASVSQYEIRTQELVERYELREKELVLCVQQHEVREQELVLCVQQHEVREKELEVFVQQYASKEATLQETVTMLETQLATAVSEREAVMSSLESGEQQKIAELTLQVQNLNQEKDMVVSELDQVKTRNVELEELCKQLEELQEECLLKQSENDELRNRINDQQGETMALKSQVEVLLQDGDQSSQDLDVLRDLLENKEQDQEMELQEKNAFILQLETDIKKLQNENSSYVSNIESLNSQILLLQADLNASVSESKSFKTLAERFKTELMKAGKDPESVSGDTVAEDGDDELDGSDVFAVESELEVRRISANDQTNVELKGFVMESVTLSESEVRKEFVTEVSQRVLDEGVVRTENIQSLGSAFYSIVGGGSVTRTPETDSQIVTLNKEIALLKDVCKGHEEKVTHLLNDNSVLKTEVNNFKTQSAALEAKMGEIESQNGILVNQQQESYSVLQSLSSELQITCDKLKESKHKYEHVSQQLSDHLEENAALVAKLSETGEEVKLIQHKLDESEKKLTALELESKQIKAELEGKCLEYENQLSEMQQTKIVPESAESREHDAEIQRLQKELEEAKAGLEEVCLGAERGAEALQNQCDRYAAEAAALQTELSQANKDLSQAREELSQAREDLSQAREDLSQAREELSQAREEQSQAREDLSQANEDLSQANEDLSKVREELSQANEELSQSQERIVAFEHEQKELLAKTESLQQELTTTNVEFCHVRDMLEKGQEESKSLESDKDRYDDEVQSLKQKLDIARAELQQEQEKSISLQCEVSSMKKEMENVHEVMAKNKQEVTSLREQYDSQSEGFEKEKKQIIETLEMNLKESESQRDILSEEVASTTQRLHSALSEIGKVNLSLQQTEELTEQSLKELQDKCKSYEETIKTLQTETEHLHELEKQVVELKKEQELMKTDLDSRELQISNLRGEVEQRDVELCSVKEMSESKVREDQLQITQLQEELQKLQIELEESALKFASTQDTSEKVSTELNDTKSLLLTKQSELDQTVAKLQELTFGAEQSQVELQMKCADQAAEISKLGLDKERVMKELEKVVAEAETTRTALVTDIEKFRMEAGSLQTELQQVKLEHDNRLTEERHVRSEFKSQLDVASSETTQLQTALDKANKEVEETKCEMQKLRCEYEVQLEQYEKHVDDLKNQNRANKTEVEHLQRNSQCEEETKMELQNLIEHSMAEIKSLQDDKKLSKEELEDVQTKNQSLEEALYIEQAARVEVQSQYDSISSEFDRVNASEKKLKKDFVNYVQRIEFLITLTNLNNENIQHVDVSNIGTGLGLLEEYLNRMKVYLEEQTAIQEGLTEKVTCLEASNTELNHWISSLSGSEEALKTAVEDLKEHLEQAEVQGSSALAEMKSCQQRVETLQEEKEILKANFDSCMVDMQQKLSEQDMRTRKLQGEMMETAKEKDRDINETKMMYDAHISQLEEKQLVVEAELARAKKIISESTDTKSSDLETYENKVSEMEESISRLEFEKTKLQDQLAKCSENFQQEKEEIKSIFESQITELEENCKALESTMFRLKDQLSDAAKAHEQEKEDIEKNFDMQLSEWEDRCRIFEMDNGKLKRQMDEMDKDFKSEKEEMEKMYERQLIDLEDRCSQSELTANKSKRNMADISVDFDDAKVSYQIQVQELEERCVELEKSRLEVQERLELVSESAQQERKSLQGSMSSQISDIQKRYTVLETEYAALKDVFEQTQISHKDEVDQLKLDCQRKMAGLEQPSVQMVQESLQVETAFSGKEEIQSLRTNTEVYKLEIDRLRKEKEDIQTELEVEREHVKEVTQKLENLNTNHKRETENYRMQIESMASGEGSEAVKENMDRMRSEIDKLTLEIASSKQDMKKEKQKLKAAKLAGEKSKKEAQMMKASSDQEVQSLKLRLEAWEVELIQRRKFVEQDQTGVDSEGAGSDAGSKRQAELETLVKNYERKVDDLTRKLKQHETDPRQLNVVQGSTEPRQEGFEALEEPPFTDAFEPEPLTPDMLQNQPRFPSDGGYIPKETVVPIMQGFQPELEGHGEGFVPEAVHPLSHNLTLNMPKEQQANVQTESHSAQPNDNLTSGDGFQPEVDDSKTDTFQPEAAGEFKPDHIQSKTHLTLSTLPQLSTLTTEAKSSANTTGTQTEASDLLSPSTTELDLHGPTLTSSASDSSMSEDLQLMKRQHEHEKDLLEEEYSRKMKSLEVELQHKHQTAMEEYQKSVDQKMQQDLSIRTQKKHQEFIMELRKARKKLEAKHKSEVEKVKHEMSSRLEAAVVEQSESELLKQLHKENQELAEARDALLQEISQNQQSREEQESWQTKPEIKTSSPKADQSTDESQRDSSDRHQSDRFLEELESLSQRSGSELPLEWEMAMSVEDGVFDRELDGDGYCARHECLEMKQRYQRLLELYQRAQGDTESVFIVEHSPERNPSSSLGRRSRIDSSEQGSENTGSSYPRHEGVDTSQEVSEGDFEDSFKDRIQKLEAENIALEKKLCDQLEKFSVEKHHLEKRCEHLQINLNNTAFSRQEVEDKLVQQNEILQSSLSQLRTEFKSPIDEEILEEVVDQSTCAFGMASVQTQTEISGDTLVTILNEQIEASQGSFVGENDSADDILEKTLSAKKEGESCNPDARMSTPKSEKKNVRTELSFTDSEAGTSGFEQPGISSASSPGDSFLLPSIDHMESMIFSDSRSSLSPTSRGRKKKEPPIEISFNTTSVVSMKSTEGGTSVNQEQIEITGTVKSAGTIVPEDYAKVALEIHHTELVEEITRLKRDLHETKAMYARENALLQEQVEREKIARQLWLEKRVPDDQLIKELPLQTDVIELRQEVALLKENNKMVMSDNKHLMEQVREKECVLLHFRDKYDLQAIEPEEFSHGSDTQLLIIQKQRDELLEELKDFHSEHERLLSVLDARTIMEETLRREKEMLLEKLVQHEDVQNISTQKHLELEFIRGEQRRLEQLLLLKDENEQQLLKQKRILEGELYDIEGRLREREAFLEEEKHRLLREVKEKNLTIMKLETMTGGSTDGHSGHGARRASTGHVPSGTKSGVSSSLVASDTPYDEAIEILREKLKLEYEVKEAVIQEQHAGQTAAFWQQQNKKLESLRVQHESQMAALQGELDAERDRGSQQDLQLQEQHQQSVARLRGELAEEKAALLDTVLTQISELTHRQIQQAKHENQDEVELQVKSMKVAMEQIHTSQLSLVRSELEAEHAAHITCLRKTLTKEQLASVETTLHSHSQSDPGATSGLGSVDERLTQRYEHLVQRINEQLELQVLRDLEEAPPGGDPRDLSDPSTSEAIRNLLESQREEISQLRSQMLSEYEMMLQARTQGVTSQSEQVTVLQREMEALQSQYEDQVRTFPEKLALTSESDKEKIRTQEQQTKELESLRTYYEKHVQDIEKTYSDEITDLRTKYETQISNMLTSTDRDSENLSDSREFEKLAKEREYVQRTTMLTVITDSDESSATESPRGAHKSVSRLSDLERLVQERDVKISDLEKFLEEEKGRSRESAEEVKSLKDQLNEQEKRISDLNSELSEKVKAVLELQNVVSDKEKDILELQCVVSDREKDVEDIKTVVSDKEKVIEGLEGVVAEKEKLLQNIEDEKEKYLSELQEKDIRSDDSSSVDYSQEKHELITKLEELEHSHKQELESLRHDLEHDTQVEIETLQSEFKVQLEIELKRQAAELQTIHEENVKNLEFSQQVSGFGRVVSREVTSVVTREVTSVDTNVQLEQIVSVDTGDSDLSSSEGISSGATAVAVDVVDADPVDVDVVDAVPVEDTVDADAEVRIQLESKIKSLEAELEKLQSERDELCQKHHQDIESLQSQLDEERERYDKLVSEMDDEEVLKDKYDQQLELSKQLMQQEFTETLESERTRFMERHRKMMDNFMADRTQEAEELKAKQEAELQQLKDQLISRDAEVARLTSQHAEELETVERLQTEADAENSDDERKRRDGEKDESDGEKERQTELIERHKGEMEEVENKWKKQLEELKAAHEDELSAAALDTEAVKAELETAHQRELQDLETRLSRSHQTEMEDLCSEHQHKMDQLLRQQNDQSRVQHQESLDQDDHDEGLREAMREVSEVVLPAQTTPLLSATDLDSTLESEVSGAEGDHLMKSTPRDLGSEAGGSRGSTPDEMLATRSFAEVVRGIPPIVSEEEMREKEERIHQLEEEVRTLRTRLESEESEEQLLTGRRAREAEEEGNLVMMLRGDLDRISAERDAVQNANDRLLQVLTDSVKNYVSVEDIINKKLTRLVNQSGSRSRPSSGTSREDGRGTDADGHRESRGHEFGARAPSPRSDRADTSQDSTALEETSILSNNTDEGLDLSQRLTESIFTGPELDAEGEEILSDARGRLQTSVNSLLEMIEKTTQQLMEAKHTQQELVETLASRSTEAEVLQARCTDIDDRLREEVAAKEYLSLELHKAEGLISGYATERDGLEQRLECLEEQRQGLALDLETTRNKLQEFQNAHHEIQSRQESVDRQEQILRENVGQETQALLLEVTSLTVDKQELEKQTKHQLDRSQSRINELEHGVEEMERLHEQGLERKREEIEDLRLQLDSVERQLKASKQFLAEQSGEREQEREDYQREVERLQEMLQDRDKRQSAQGRLQREVQDLSEQLQDRLAVEGELDEQTRRLRLVLQDKELTASELKEWVTQLEKEVDERAALEHVLKQKIVRLEKQLSLRPVPDETSDSSLNSTAEQPLPKPDLMSPDRRSPLRRQITLEEELEKTRKTGEELALEKDVLQQQVREQLLQISALRNQLDDMRHYGGEAPTATHASQLRERLAVERESLEMKEEEVTSLQEQKDGLKQKLQEKETELQRLRAELDESNHHASVDPALKAREENAHLKAEVEKLLGHQEDSVEVGLPRLTQDLLDEKNREIDDLSEQISQLQMALEATSIIDDSVRENDEMELLREELRQKAETISELQEKLSSVNRGSQFFGDMSLTDADRSLLESSFTEKTNFQQELEETIAQKEDEMSDLRKELETSQLALTEVEAEKISLKTEMEQRVKKLEMELESARTALTDAEQNQEQSPEEIQEQSPEENQEQSPEEIPEDKVEMSHEKDQMEILQTELEQAQQALKEAQEQLKAQEQIDEMQKELQKVQGALKETDARNSDLQKELKESKEALKEAEEKLTDKDDVNVDELRKELEEAQQALKVAEEKLQSGDSDSYSELQKQLEDVHISLKEAEEKLTTQDSELQQTVEESHQALKDAKEKLHAEHSEKMSVLQKELEETRVSLKEAEEKVIAQDSELQQKLEEVQQALNDAQEKLQLQPNPDHQTQLEEAQKALKEAEEKLHLQSNNDSNELQRQLKEVRVALAEANEARESLEGHLSERESELNHLQEERDHKQLALEQVNVQVDAFQEEIKSLTGFQTELQKDFDTVQSMLEEKEREIETLTRELTESRIPPEGATSELQDKYDAELLSLKKTIQAKVNIIEEKEEELYVLNEKLELQDTIGGELSTVRQQLADTEVTLDDVRLAKQNLEEEVKLLQQKLESSSVEFSHEDGQEKESSSVSISQLQEELSQKEEKLDSVRAEVEELKERLSEQQKELNDVRGKLQEKEVWLEEQQAGQEEGGQVERLQRRIVELEEEKKSIEEGQVEELRQKIEDLETRLRGRDASGIDGGEVVEEDAIVVDLIDEVEGVPAERDCSIEGDVDIANETRNIMEELNMKISELEEALHEKEELLARLSLENSEATPAKSDLSKQLSEKTQLYDQLLTDKIMLEQTVIDLETKLEEKQEYLENLDYDKNELSEKEELIAKLKQELKDKETDTSSGQIDSEESERLRNLQKEIEEKELKIIELKSQCAEQKQQLETGGLHILQQQVQEKNLRIEELEAKYEDLKQQMREEAGKLEEEIQKIHQIQERQPDMGVLAETQQKVKEVTAELGKTREKLLAAETSLEQTLVQLAERDEQIKALFEKGQPRLDTSSQSQEEVNRALEDSQQEVYELSLELREKDEDLERLSTALTATEEELEIKSSRLRTVEEDHEKILKDLRETEEKLKQTSFELTNAQRDQLSTSLPLDLDEDHQLMTRSESEPALNNWRRESHLFRSRLHEVESLVRQQKQELGSKNKELSVVRKQLEQWLSQGHGDGDVKTHITSLQQEIQERDKKNQLLQAEIDELNETLLIRDTEIHAVRASESQRYSSAREATPPESEHQIRHLRHELRKAKSALAEIHHNGDFLDRTPEGSATEDDQSPLRLGEDARNLRREVAQLKEELQIFKTTASMSSRDFVKKVMELRQELSEEHKNHIRDIQERLKMDAESQLTTLQLRHEDEIKQLRQLHDRKMQAVLAEQRQDLEKQHKTEINRLIAEHKQEVDLVRDEGIVRDDASVTDLRQSLISDIQQTELMDNRLMEQLDGPGGEDSDTTSITDTASIEAAPPGAISTKLQVLLSRLHKKGVHVLTLSELQFLQRHMSHDHLKGDIDIDAVRQAWERERETLLSTINSLKDLLARVHKANNVDRCEGEEDWRGDLLAAVCGLFDKEREVVLAELRTYVVTHAPDADPSTRRLEQRISDQEVLHRSALDQLRHSDRQSMLSEMEALRKKASETRRQTDEQQREYSTTLSSLEDHNAKRERQQQRQIQVLEYKLQQEKVIQDDLKTSLDLERQRVREVSGELSREKNTSLEIQGELSTVQIQLSKARDALEREHNRFISVTEIWNTVIDALEEERTKNSRLSELLESERRKCVLLNSQVIDLRSHNKDYLEKESRFVEQLRIELEREREKRVECSRQTEQERSAKHGVQQELEGERRKMRSVQTDCDALVAQLKLSLEAERGKVEDLTQNMDEERQTTTRLRTALELERTNHQEAASQDRGTIEDMEARLRSDQAQVEDLHRSLAREKQKVVSVSEMLETERENTRQTLEHERAVNRQLKRDAEDLQVEKTELKRQVEFEGETIKTYQNQTEQLHEEVKVLKQRENEFQMRTDSQQAAVRKTVRDLERERDELKIKLHELELETDRLTDKVQDTQLQLDDVRGRELQTRHELDRLRLTTTTHHTTTSSDRPPAAAVNVRTSVDGRPTLRKDNFDNLVQRLEFLALRMQDDVTLTPRQSRGDEVDAQVDTTSNYVADIQAVLVDMKQLQQPLESSEVCASASAGQLANERIVQHNAELTLFLKRVCQEKEELRVTLDAMEEDVARLRRQGIHTQVRRNEEEEEDRYLQDRMSWASERLSLQMTLDTAEHEVERLQSEIRHVRGQLDSEGYLTEADRDKMQRLYGKFLRSESFRKALVYQKRYLLMLLGGYQDCEQETLMLIAQMGGYPSDIDARRRSRHSRLFGLFRSAARVIIAIARMRFMVRKWRRAIRVGSPVVSGRVNMNVGYMPSTYTHPQPATSPRYFPSMSRIPDLPRSSTSEPLLVLNGDVANPYRLTSSAGATRRQFTTPPTKDTSASHTSCDRTPSSSARRRLLQTNTSGTMSTYGRSHPMTRATTADESTDDFLHRLENLQTRLGSYTTGSSPTRTSAWR
ncbi:extracellular matrix-binding protein ebh-like isoform X2 [Haliotis cracherodii]|uniref:extracellular matrix-binding protein ebh-like isoform X2 n=1 Tax=Haliotis cracherodii TaxID=6455 RepID=UPI0039EACE54